MAKSLLPTTPKIRGLGQGTPRTNPKPPPLGQGRSPATVDFRLPTSRPRGPRGLHINQRRAITGGPGLAPAGFVSPTTSTVEWYWYWGSYVVLKLDGDPRRGPFIGVPGIFDYQLADDPNNPRSVASAVSDFVYHLGTGEIIVRIDTYYYHLATTPQQIARDAYLKLHGQNVQTLIVSAWDYDIIGDPSGRAVCAAVANAVAGKERISPIKSGHAFPPRDLIKESAA